MTLLRPLRTICLSPQSPKKVLTVRKVGMLDALGVVAYSRVRRVKALQARASKTTETRAAPERLAARNWQSGQDAKDLPSLPARAHTPNPIVHAPAVAAVSAQAIIRPTAKSLVSTRAASVRSELVVPSAEIERFLDSRMYRHICLLLAQGGAIPVVENAVTSDTALHFELPPKSPLKLGSMALLRSAWRAKRQAWLAIRLWRKQQR